jgi:hypothetical protein
MALGYVEDLVVSMLNFCQNRKMVMMGEVASLNVELIEDFMMTDTKSPNLFNMSIFKFPLEHMM